MLDLLQVMRRGASKLIGPLASAGATRATGPVIVNLRFGHSWGDSKSFDVACDEQGASQLVAIVALQLQAFNNGRIARIQGLQSYDNEAAALWLRKIADRVEVGERI